MNIKQKKDDVVITLTEKEADLLYVIVQHYDSAMSDDEEDEREHEDELNLCMEIVAGMDDLAAEAYLKKKS